ncbi:MAG TPA: type 4a pilus biogenesis protein PilO [Phycisphaerae bacterium]|jgi:Tfp pilus assembly protein PilO|nr:type 4a pilus biogenesis protein PilO [Phycisphaerae bacterium]
MTPNLIASRLRTINLVAALGLLALLSGTAALGVGIYKHGTEQMKESRDLNDRLGELNGLSQTLAQVEAAKAQTEARLAEAEAQLPTSNAMDQFMQELAKVAEKAGLQVDGTVPSKEIKDSGGYKTAPFEISGTGDWDSCYRFLTGLRATKRLTRLDSLTLDGSKEHKEDANSPPNCHIVVNLSVFMAR